jgi:hypothetical protein
VKLCCYKIFSLFEEFFVLHWNEPFSRQTSVILSYPLANTDCNILTVSFSRHRLQYSSRIYQQTQTAIFLPYPSADTDCNIPPVSFSRHWLQYTYRIYQQTHCNILTASMNRHRLQYSCRILQQTLTAIFLQYPSADTDCNIPPVSFSRHRLQYSYCFFHAFEMLRKLFSQYFNNPLQTVTKNFPLGLWCCVLYSQYFVHNKNALLGKWCYCLPIYRLEIHFTFLLLLKCGISCCKQGFVCWLYVHIGLFWQKLKGLLAKYRIGKGKGTFRKFALERINDNFFSCSFSVPL